MHNELGTSSKLTDENINFSLHTVDLRFLLTSNDYNSDTTQLEIKQYFTSFYKAHSPTDGVKKF